MGWHDDYFVMRPGTPGGEKAISDFKRQITPLSFPSPDKLGPVSPAEPKRKGVLRQSQAPSVPFEATKLDVLVSLMVWVVTWIALYRSLGGLGAFCVGIIPAGIAIRWWKQLLVLGIVGIVVLVWLRSR